MAIISRVENYPGGDEPYAVVYVWNEEYLVSLTLYHTSTAMSVARVEVGSSLTNLNPSAYRSTFVNKSWPQSFDKIRPEGHVVISLLSEEITLAVMELADEVIRSRKVMQDLVAKHTTHRGP